ncbi:APC family permease [Streptomyces sp. NPDC056670]|uniref:APC family permease n=1 Tax=Streptomyces sp. NPDC056670 TaxID=3345904 RepID=UPI0036909E63
MSGLQKSLGGAVGTFLALSTILGSGMMILPGTSYQQLGRSAWMPWAIAAVSVIPLLYCYAWLGRRYPSASGVSHYSEVAFGRPTGRSAGLLATLALVAGIPATAITGGRYVAEFSGVASLAWLFPVAVLAAATVIGCLGTNVSGKVQVALVLALFVLVTCTALVALGVHGVRAPSVEVPPLGELGSVLTAVYVAFTGWETVAFTFEEHKRPDAIPRIFAASYVIVVALYGLVLLGLFSAVDPGDKALDQAPLLRLAERSLGDLGRPVTLALVVAAITANVCASVLALSRLVFGMARSGYLPGALSRVRERDGNPVTAVLAVGAALTLIAVLGATGVMSFQLLFVLSGGIYFVLYGLGAASYTKLAGQGPPRLIAALCAVTVVAVTVLAGPPMWLCWALFAVVLLVTAVLARRASRRDPSTSARADEPAR